MGRAMRANEFITEAPLPPDWDQSQFVNNRTSFKSRLAYALERAKRIGTGSSRVAMTIEYDGRPTVLKIAKNQKGLAQNSVEIDILDDGYAKQLDILIPLIDYDRVNAAPTWIQTELAEKMTEKQLCNLIRCKSLFELTQFAELMMGKKYYDYNSPQQFIDMMHREKRSEHNIETITNYANTLADLANSFDLQLGDFTKAGNWGFYDGRPVLIDVGFNTNVLNTYYAR